MGLPKRFRRDDQASEMPCQRCGTPTPAASPDCTACGWDTRESYHAAPGSNIVTADAQPTPDR